MSTLPSPRIRSNPHPAPRHAMEVLLLADCPPVWRVVLMIIARHGEGAHPGLARIARLAGISRPTLVHVLKQLRARGWLTWDPGSARKHTANVYTIHYDLIPTLDWTEGAARQNPEPVTRQNSELETRQDSELVNGKENLTRQEFELVKLNSLTSKDSELQIVSTEVSVPTSSNEDVRTSSPSPAKAVSEGRERRQRKIAKKIRDKAPTKTDFAKARHSDFKIAIFRYYQSKNGGDDPDWGPSEGAQLEMWLRQNPKVTLEQFTQMLRHRYRSEVNHADRPSIWIKHITSFRNGPLDRFGKPLGMIPAQPDLVFFKPGDRQ